MDPYLAIAVLSLVGLTFVLGAMFGLFNQSFADGVLYVVYVVIFFVCVFGYTDKARASDYVVYVPSVYHWDRDRDRNESNNFLGYAHDRWTVGTFKNSFGDRSYLAGYHWPIIERVSVTAFGAIGYDEAPIMPMIGLRYSTNYVFGEVNPVFAMIGLTIPLGGK